MWQNCTSALPLHLKASIKYGSRVAAIACYHEVYHYVPYQRLAVFLKDLFCLPISEGSIDYQLERNAQISITIYCTIQQQI